MKMNADLAITHTFQKLIRNLTACALVLALGLFAGVEKAHAATYTWTNTTGSAFNDPNGWNPNSGPPGLNDTASFTLNGTFDLPLTNNYISNIGTLLVGAGTGSGTLILTMDFGTNTFAGISGNTTSASGFVFGQQGTSIVYIACNAVLCTNSGNNARMIVGRNGPAQIFLTNGFVAAGNLVIANGTGANGSKVVVSGPNSSWSNSTASLVGSAAGTANCSLIITNSGLMVDVGTIQVGNGGFFNSLLVDTSGRLFTKNTGSIGSSAGSSNNTATIQGGGLWDCGGKTLNVGNASGFNNSLTVGSNGTVSNTTFVFLTAAGNSLVFSGGVLSVSGGVTNTSGTVSGSGTIIGNVGFVSGGSLSLGLGNSVGTLVLSNNLTLNATSTTTLKLDKTQTGSNDLLTVAGTVTEAGTLTINNVGPALVGGDTFQILGLAAQSGGFIFTNLPPLTGNLVWNTTQLGSQGIISVVLPPAITGPVSQAVLTNANVTISTVVTGVPAPGLQWQLNGVNTMDGPTGNGSTISGSASAVLTISNAQTNDSGQYCLIASNFAGAVTNCMSLTVTTAFAGPSITGPTDQNVILGQNGIFSASVAGIPLPTQQWQLNGVNIPGATSLSTSVTNVQFSQDGSVYSIIASNVIGTATNSAVLHVVVPPAIQTQPQNLIVTNTQGACFSVLSTNGVPLPTYQWQFNNAPINGATNAIYCIPSATPANSGLYDVIIANVAGSVTSTNATLTVNSTMVATVTPASGGVNVCYDTPLYMAFDRVPVLRGAGKINVFDTTNAVTPVDTIDTSLGEPQSRTIGGEVFNAYPVIISGTTVAIYPDNGRLTSNQTYYVTVDPGTFTETNGALYVGITDTNAWRFSTKPTGPANPNNMVVAADGSGDFCTVQGAVDSVPANNTTYTLINIRNGQYTEIVDTKTKNNLTFRGQTRTGVFVGYPNNNNINGSTATRMAFKVNANDNAIENMTVTNMTAKGGSQAEAIMVNTSARRCIIFNAEVDSFQDTLLINDVSSQAYVQDSLIKGDTDFIWGVGNLFVTNSQIETVTGSASVTQPRTTAGSNGFSFVNCMLTRSSSTVSNTTFARALGFCDGNVAIINCQIDSNLVGWTAADLAGCSNTMAQTEEIRWWEYNNTDLDTGSPVQYNGIILTNGDAGLACAENATCWLSGWAPQLAPNVLSSPANQTIVPGQTAMFTVSATGIPDPSYQWLKAGTNLVTATSATLTIVNADAGDAGTYSVVVYNGAGSVTNSATLTVLLTPFQTWQFNNFGCTLCAKAAATADPDGDGQDNLAEFLAGTNPNSASSYLHIISIAPQGNDVSITWATAGGATNVVQATAGDGSGNYATNNFTDISGPIAITGSGDTTTNYTDAGGATNVPSRYYRIRLGP